MTDCSEKKRPVQGIVAWKENMCGGNEGEGKRDEH